MSGDICFQQFQEDPTKIGRLGDIVEVNYLAWIIAGWATVIASTISLFLVFKHAQYYTRPNHQRYIIRIIWMIPVYSVTSWLSFYFYRNSIYFELLRDLYESLVYANFFVLLLQYLSDETQHHYRHFKRKSETIPFAFPLCWIKFRPGKAHFLQMLKYAVLQYAVLRPVLTIVACILHYYGKLCPASLSPRYFNVYFMLILSISVNVAFYALLMLYMTLADELEPYNSFWKFTAVKLILFYPFYQFVVIAVAANRGLIRETKYWTRANMVNGIQSFLVCLEFVLFAILFARVFDYREYRPSDRKRTRWWKGWMDAMNPMDFIREFWYGLKYLRWMLFGGTMPTPGKLGRRATMDIAEVMNRMHPGTIEFPADWPVQSKLSEDGVDETLTVVGYVGDDINYPKSNTSHYAANVNMSIESPYGIPVVSSSDSVRADAYQLNPTWLKKHANTRNVFEFDLHATPSHPGMAFLHTTSALTLPPKRFTQRYDGSAEDQMENGDLALMYRGSTVRVYPQ